MIIAGAGIIGLTCAWRLAQKGRRVTVFDAREAAREASWAGAGMLAPGGEFEADTAAARMAVESLRSYPEFIRELQEETGVAIDFRQSGGIEIAASESGVAALGKRAANQTVLGIHSESTDFRGSPARFYPDDAIVDPRHVTQALLLACKRRGVAIHESEPILRIAEGGGSIATAAGEYRCDGVIIAAGAWSGALYPGLPRTLPVRGHLICWRLRAGLLGPIVRCGGTYLLQRRSGALIAGSTTEHVGFDRNLDEDAILDIRARASRLLPDLASDSPSEQWNGFRPGIEAEGPAVGRVEGTSVWAAFGHYRNGILMAPETARRIAASVR